MQANVDTYQTLNISNNESFYLFKNTFVLSIYTVRKGIRDFSFLMKLENILNKQNVIVALSLFTR